MMGSGTTTTLTLADTELRDLRAFVARHRLDGALQIGFQFGRLEVRGLSHGRDKQLCQRLGRILTRLMKALEDGTITVL